ncbi:TetR family transcriptional regulator [Actinomycetospora cinnamomea]|uniref:TetR family transcriptional regulator n=1 Tax=Actinomycetospora cinnamomea TaxID=663609 RepID=A0A2U1FQU4_9PSEU|nr:TetR family transcriptional regulator [Actinomycetospora cinnamomea]PVZ14514.1 TetR family transcriptional regulator [Actinomycetospora cinnamomea]
MTGLRERKKAATRRAIQDHALRLFLDRGYDRTTVADIAEAAGVSPMTFFRYFPTKEDVVEYDEYDPVLAELVVARPAEEHALAAVGAAVAAALATLGEGELATVLVRTRLVLRTPALRARRSAGEGATRDLLAGALARREGREDATHAHRVAAAAAVAALTTALEIWVDEDGRRHLAAVVDEAFGALLDGVGHRAPGG